MKKVILSTVVVAAVALAGCGASNPNASKDLPSLDSGSATSSTRAGSTTTTRRNGTTTTAASLGTLFVDKDGYFQIRYNPAWTAIPGKDAGWYVTGSGGQSPRMEAKFLAGNPSGTTGEEFRSRLEEGIRTQFPDATGLTVKTIRPGTSNGLYSVEYSGSVGSVRLSFYQTVSLANDAAAVATLVALPADFPAALAAAKPYMLTIYALK